MSYDEHDAALDAMYEQIGRELYPDHKAQAISEFTADRLRSYYVDHPAVMRPAVEALQKGKRLNEAQYYAAALVFFVTAIELLLKATLLKPVAHGLIHYEAMADILVEHALGQTGFDRYQKLLAQLFTELAGTDLKTIHRDETSDSLLTECTTLQKLRNDIIHKGIDCDATQADLGYKVSVAVYDQIVFPMIATLGLNVIAQGQIVYRAPTNAPTQQTLSL